MLSERKLSQTCAGFSDHCVNGATCDPDTNICVTEDSKCCLYAIPEVLSTPFLRLCLTVSLTLFIVLFVSVYMSLSVLTLCPAVAIPALSNYPSDAEVRVHCAENPALPKIHSAENLELIFFSSPFKAWGRLEDIATRASTVAKYFFLVLISNFLIFSFLQILSLPVLLR